MERSSSQERLLRGLGYVFKDPSLFVAALTHSSFLNEVQDAGAHNERLEFLGDAVLDLLVAQALMEAYPEAREGSLSKMRSALVHEGALARVARKLEVGPALRLGRGEETERNRDSLLADALEALLAAVYLDGGFSAAQKVVTTHFDVSQGPELGEPKSTLQERVQAATKKTPHYSVTEQGTVQQRSFVAEVWLERKLLGRGEGPSKQKAEQAAARKALQDWE